MITTILIETMYNAIEALAGSHEISDIDYTQVTISKGRKTKTGTMMLSRNPVLLISATKI